MRRPSLSPEARLLFVAAAASPSDAVLRDALNAGIDWDKLCTLSEEERATQVVARKLAGISVDPANAGYKRLRNQAALSAINQLHLEQLLHNVLEVLGEQQIETLLLKGAGLAYTAYPSFSERPMSDLDLLFRSDDAERAWSLLQAHGWRSTEAHDRPAKLRGHQHLPRLSLDPGGFGVEVHHALFPAEHPFRFSTETFWAASKEVTVNGRSVRVPHPVHQLWHACVHFAWSHLMEWGSWRTFRDVTALVHADSIEWDSFLRFAAETGAGTCCFWTLHLARCVTDAPVPIEVLRSLRPPYPPFVLSRLERHFLAGLCVSDRCPSIRLSQLLWAAAIAPRSSGHGSSRPWHVTDRWLAGAEPTSQEEVIVPLRARLAKIAGGTAYLLRLSWLSVPLQLGATLIRHN